MEILKIVGIGLVGVTSALVLGQYKKEYTLMVSVVTGAVIMYICVDGIKEIIDTLFEMLNNINMGQQYMEILIKAMGVCFLTQISSDACKDSGNTAIASKIEIAGKIIILIIALPMFISLLELMGSLMVL